MSIAKKLKSAIEHTYFPVRWHMRRFPKAAKKWRVLNKWINRFNPDIKLADCQYKVNPFLKMLPIYGSLESIKDTSPPIDLKEHE